MRSRLKALAASWDANAGSWTRAVREGRIASRAAGTDAAILGVVAERAPRRLLDAGCGEGWLVRAAREATGCAAIGIDGAAALVEAARAADPAGDYRALGYEALVAGGHGLPADFDLVVFNYALFDADAGVTALLSVARALLAPGGAVAIQTLHPDAAAGEGWQIEDFAGFEGEAEGWAPMPWYARSRSGWRSVIAQAGLVPVAEREPAAADGGPPLSLLIVCEASPD